MIKYKESTWSCLIFPNKINVACIVVAQKMNRISTIDEKKIFILFSDFPINEMSLTEENGFPISKI